MTTPPPETYVDLREHVEEAAAGVGGAAEGLEHSEPLGAESRAARRQLRTQHRQLVESETEAAAPRLSEAATATSNVCRASVGSKAQCETVSTGGQCEYCWAV